MKNLERLATEKYISVFNQYKAVYEDSLEIDNPIIIDNLIGLLKIFKGEKLPENLNSIVKSRLKNQFKNYDGLDNTIKNRLQSLINQLRNVKEKENENIANNIFEQVSLESLKENEELNELEVLEKVDLILDNPEILQNSLESYQEKVVNADLESILFNAISFSTAKLFKREFVGVITQEDHRVRMQHLANNRKFWIVSQRQDFSLDPGCRCFYYYGTKEFMKQMGFTRF